MNKKHKEEISKTIARGQDKTIQITFNIPKEKVKITEEKVLEDIGKSLSIPGFRKGKAPLAKVKENTSRKEIIEKVISLLVLPELAKVLENEKIKPVVYPQFELISIKEGEDWQIRVTTCEMPEVFLGDYKKEIIEQIKTEKIWTPNKKSEEKKEVSREEKENMVIETLLKTIKVEIPSLIVKENVETRLSQLLERLEKLGLTLEKYLESTGKTAEELRKEYERQTKESITLELALTRIGDKENIVVDDKEIEEFIKASSLNPEEAERLIKDKERKEMVKNIILRRKALDFLVSLV